MYSLANGAEPSAPSTGYVAAFPNQKAFDIRTQNTFLGEGFSFPQLQGRIVGATLMFRARPIGNGTNPGASTHVNDTTGLRFYRDDGSLEPDADNWNAAFGPHTGVSLPLLNPILWSGATQPAAGLMFVLDLAVLPQVVGTLNLIDDLNTFGFVDFFAQDDTEVDFVSLKLVVPEPSTVLLLVTVFIGLCLVRGRWSKGDNGSTV